MKSKPKCKRQDAQGRCVRTANARADYLLAIGEKQIRRHLSRGRSSSDIAIMMNIPVSRVCKMIEEMEK